MHIVIQKQMLTIYSEIEIAIPMSHYFEERSEALRWMMKREMQSHCYVVSKSKFLMWGGV